jgi:purine-binding chemotaxis protein CheW
MSHEGLAKRFATFTVSDMFFGIDVLNVQEVLRRQQMTHIPLAPDVIAGLINLRGQIVPAINMRRRLGLQARGEDENFMNVVTRTQDGPVSLLVDEIGDVLDVDLASFEGAPENLSRQTRDLIRGIYKLKDRLMLVLDTERTAGVAAEVAAAVAIKRLGSA